MLPLSLALENYLRNLSEVASYNNYYGNTVYGILGGRVSELIMDIAMSDNC